MTTHGGEGAAPAVPRSAWVLAWSSLASQLAYLGRSGLRLEDVVSVVGSVLLGALLVGWFSAGVMRARMVRLVVVWILLVVTLVFEVAGLWGVDGPGELLVAALLAAIGAVQVAALWRYCRTDWFAWHRAEPPRDTRPDIRPLIVVAVVVGVLGGLAQQAEPSANLELRVGAADG